MLISFLGAVVVPSPNVSSVPASVSVEPTSVAAHMSCVSPVVGLNWSLYELATVMAVVTRPTR